MFSMYLTVYYIFYKAAILSNFQQDVKSLQIGNIRVNDIHTVCTQWQTRQLTLVWGSLQLIPFMPQTDLAAAAAES